MSNVFTKTLAAIVVTLVSFGFAVMPAAAAFSAAETAALSAAGFDAATIAALELVLGGGSSTPTTGSTETVSSTQPTGYFHSTTLVLGSRGAQVSALQSALNSCYSAGLVADGSFGPGTKAAVMNAQAALGVSVDGVVGPVTGSMLGSCTVTTTVATGTGSTTTDDSSDNGNDQFVLAGGDEATVEDFEIDDGDDDDIDEGQTAEVAEITFDVEDADVLMERLDLVFTKNNTTDTNNTGEDTKPWKVFENVTITVNGEEIADLDASDDDEWGEDDYITAQPNGSVITSWTGDEYRLRFKGLSEVLEEGEEATIGVEVEASSSVDMDTDNEVTWEITVPFEGIRMVDEAGLTQETPTAAAGYATSFTIGQEGAEDKIKVSSSTNDPDSTTFEIDNDSKSDEFSIFMFEVEADEDSSDLEVNDVYFSVTTNSPTTAASPQSIIDKIYFEIDGEREDAEVSTAGTAAAGTDVTTIYKVEYNNAIEIDAGDEIDAEVFVKLKGYTGNYDQGTTISASATTANVQAWDVEGSDDLSTSQLTGSATGETHDLYEEGIIVTLKETSVDTMTIDGDDNDYSELVIEFKAEAFGQDIYIDKDVIASATSLMTTAAGTASAVTTEVGYHVQMTGGTATAPTATFTSTADEKTNSFLVEDGKTETFTLKITAANAATSALDNQSVRAFLTGIGWATTDVSGTNVYTLNLVDDYKTGYGYIAN